MRWPSLILAGLSVALSACSEGELPRKYRQVAVPHEVLASEEAWERGRELFVEHCALCHGERADGQGRRRNLSAQPQDFTDVYWQAAAEPRRVFFYIREGKRGTPMPAWKILDEEEAWDLTAYVLRVGAEGP